MCNFFIITVFFISDLYLLLDIKYLNGYIIGIKNGAENNLAKTNLNSLTKDNKKTPSFNMLIHNILQKKPVTIKLQALIK